MSTSTILEKQILATVVYYDILNYPLTSFEIFFYLIKDCHCKEKSSKQYQNNMHMNLNTKLLRSLSLPYTSESFSEVIELLNISEYLKNNLDQNFGFYFLKGRDEIVEQRLNRKKIWDSKWKKSKKIFWIMQIVPFAKLVMGSGSFSLGNPRKDSDVDLMIVAKKGKIWTVRTFFTLLTSLLRVRRHKNKTEDMICLNHYITDKSLRIPFESLYTAQLYYHILSIYNSDKDRKLFLEFQKANEWMKKYLENYEFSEIEGLRSIKRSKVLSLIAKIFEFTLSGKMGDYFEKKMSEIQTNRIKKDPLNMKKGGRITISNEQLEFHPDSHESHIIPEFNQKMKELGIFEFASQKDSGLNV
ncbi:MAG: hypothetical protein P1P85_01230 [Patescibacteria group bacterium]|nr:hypothetical protein [Patescibacteria group bacterium]